jgi:phage terminase small subunit
VAGDTVNVTVPLPDVQPHPARQYHRGDMDAPVRFTPKQETFCLRYAEGLNATEAALAAGYSSHTARVIGYENLLKPYIADRIEDLRQKATDDSVASVLERKQVLTEIIRGRLAHFIGKGATAENLQSAALQEITVTGTGENKATKVKLHPIATAIDLLNKMDGANAPLKSEHTGKDGGPIEYTDAKQLLTGRLDRLSERIEAAGPN